MAQMPKAARRLKVFTTSCIPPRESRCRDLCSRVVMQLLCCIFALPLQTRLYASRSRQRTGKQPALLAGVLLLFEHSKAGKI